MKTMLTLTTAALLATTPLALAQTSNGMNTQDSGQAAPMQAPAAADATAAETKVDTATFIKTVPGANAFEIESSRLALTKASSDDVKAFAQMMVDDHTKAGEDFKAALEKVQTTSATKPSGKPVDAKQQAMMDELKAADGDAFEAKYIAMQTEAHRQAVALFSGYANSGDDPALKEFAKATLPTLQLHEKKVKELSAKHQG